MTPAPRLSVAPDGTHLLRDGRPWALVADTTWMAFTHVPDRDWEAYLQQRRADGFEALLISTMPVLHDMSVASPLAEPVHGFWGGSPRWGPLSAAYLEHASGMLERAVALGFTPCLVALWCNYAPGTWASNGREAFVIPDAAVPEVLASLVDAFGRFEPAWIVAGDTDFRSPRTQSWYASAHAELLRLAPGAVTTFHMQDDAVLPPDLAGLPDLGFYSYQSGHRAEWQHLAWDYGERYAAITPRKPVINLEPCYEGSGHGFRFGRFSAEDVRRATWQSLLSGASAGIAYGAHGIWQWHGPASMFNNPAFSSTPFDARTCLGFPGARDVTFAAALATQLGLLGASPAQHLLADPPPGIRAATTQDGHLAIYAPVAWEIRLATQLAVVDAVAWDLGARILRDVDVRRSHDHWTVGPVAWNGDALLVVHTADALRAGP